MSSIRDDLRAATLGAKAEFKKEIVSFGGVELELRQPSVKQRKDLFKRCMDENGRVEAMEYLTWGVLYCTFVPGTNERVYDDTDYDALMEKPSGGFLDKFGAIIGALMNVDDDIEKKS